MSSPISRKLERCKLRQRSTLAVADAIRGSLDALPRTHRQRMENVADRLRSCAITQYVALRTPVGDASYLQVSNKRACKIRLCPQCLYRSACRDRATLNLVLADLWKHYSTSRAILCTLTTRNRSFSSLKDMLRDHQKGLKRFWKARRIVQNTLGSFTATELEIRGTKEHPEAGIHSHSIILVPACYFAGDVPAIWHREFRDLWRNAARLDYDPIVDVRVVRARDGDDSRAAIHGAIAECAKYCISLEGLFDHESPDGIRCDGLIAVAILDAFHRQRLHSFERCFAEAKKRVRHSDTNPDPA